MASKKFGKTSEEFKFFGEFWQLAQKYYIPEDNDDYWQDLIKDCSELGAKYDGVFYRYLLVGLQNALDEVHKGKVRN